jgi:sporulation protein YlmC with PRC-barrel domain
MNRREVRLEQLMGRKVRDAEGRNVGRIYELEAVIELHAHGNEYVVTAYDVCFFGAFEWFASSHFGRHFLLMLGPPGGHRRYQIPWEVMDLSDPLRPRLTQRIDELSLRQ